MTSLNKHWKLSIKQKEDIRKRVSGNKNWLGKKHSESTKKKMSKSHKGLKKGISISAKHKIKIGYSLIGNKNSFNKFRGEASPHWKGGITSSVQIIRHCFKYRQWRSDIFTRDNFTCQKCLIRGGNLESHHIKPFSKIIEEYQIKTLEEALNCEELWNINNGETLCLKCHNKIKQDYA